MGIRLIVLLLILTSASCTVTQKKLIGTYAYCPRFEICATLQLNADSTFVYTNELEKAAFKAAGFWRLDKKGLLLNSYSDNRNKPITFEHASQKGFSVNIKDETNMPLPGPFISFYHNSEIITAYADKNGSAHVDLANIDSVTVVLVGFRKVHFVPLTNTNCFDIILDNFPIRMLKNERWKIRGRKIYLPQNKTKGGYAFRKERSI